MIESFLAGATLSICVGLLLHMAIGPARRESLRRYWLALRSRSGAPDLRRLWSSRRQKAAARQEADDVIKRARRAAETADRGEWDGNVYRPKAFDRGSGNRSEKKNPPPH